CIRLAHRRRIAGVETTDRAASACAAASSSAEHLLRARPDKPARLKLVDPAEEPHRDSRPDPSTRDHCAVQAGRGAASRHGRSTNRASAKGGVAARADRGAASPRGKGAARGGTGENPKRENSRRGGTAQAGRSAAGRGAAGTGAAG